MNTATGPQLRAMIQQARDCARTGRPVEAAQMWQRIVGLDPNNTEALLALSTQALASRDAQSALGMLRHAATTATHDPMVQLYIALACKELGDVEAEQAAVTRALSIDPYFYPALLHKGMLLERIGKRRQAARVFRDVIKIMPEPDKVGAGFQRAVQHAESAIRENQDSLEKHLEAVLSGLRGKHAQAKLGRFERSVQVLLGRKKIYAPEPVMLHYADLPPIQFYDRELFPWIGPLEAATDAVRDELRSVLADSRGEFAPDVHHPAGTPVNQWKELNDSPRWSTYFLWRNGEKQLAHCERCPRTAALLEALPMAEIPNFSPTAMFSCLEPRTVIPPHNGETNTRLIVHLPLIIPDGCSFRVGNETRPWICGEAFAFDDSIEHEARNDSGKLRVVLIFEVWNPYLDPAERELTAALVNGLHDYYRAEA